MQSSKQPRPQNGTNPYASVGRDRSAAPLSYGQVSGETLRECVVSVVDSGDAVLFGRTSDGGALSVRVLHNGATNAWYATDASELQELLEALVAVTKA